MYKIYLLILLIITSLPVKSQELLYIREIGSFQSASAISINQSAFIYVSDLRTNEIYKLDTLGNELKSIGGYGWSASSFDNPSDLFANTLNVYVADRNNDRIQIFDKDLNYLSEISSNKGNEKFQFRFPGAVGVNSQGDLFLLDTDNARILKFNFRGEFISEIGGFESGSFILNKPKDLTINNSNQIILLDSDDIVFFDQFGNLIIKTKQMGKITNLNFSSNCLILTGDSFIGVLNGGEYNRLNETKLFNLPSGEKAVDAAIFNDKLFVLTESRILIYNTPE